MPMYEYGCLACDSRFDRLRRMDQDDSGVTCPRCGGAQVQRQMSVFAAHSRGGSASMSEASAPVSSGGGGGCGGGCCGGGCATRN
jgi:putative FmdB family regulatory protein